jgi:hypothetical protein
VIFWGTKLVAFWTNQKLGIFFLSSAVLANFSHFWKKLPNFILIGTKTINQKRRRLNLLLSSFN